jgi:hypothetical protein
VAEKQLDNELISSASVDERRLWASQRVRTEEARVQSDAGNPNRNQPRVPPGRDGLVTTAAADEEKLPGFLPGALTYASTASRVYSVNSNLTGCLVFL